MKLDFVNFKKIIDSKYIFENRPNIAVAVSGGPDSMALLYLMKNWIFLKRGNIIALIVNHNIRTESKNEADYIARQLKKDKIDAKILSVSKSKILKKTMSEARENRFLKLTNYCKKTNITSFFSSSSG